MVSDFRKPIEEVWVLSPKDYKVFQKYRSKGMDNKPEKKKEEDSSGLTVGTDSPKNPLMLDPVSDAKMVLKMMASKMSHTRAVSVGQAKDNVEMMASSLENIHECLTDAEFLKCRDELEEVILTCNEVALAKEAIAPVVLPLGDIIAMMLMLPDVGEGQG